MGEPSEVNELSEFDKDDLVLQELKSQNIEGLTGRGRVAVRELADQNQGAVIFLILSMNSRIRELESQLSGLANLAVQH